jgi:hypothetical protein
MPDAGWKKKKGTYKNGRQTVSYGSGAIPVAGNG